MQFKDYINLNEGELKTFTKAKEIYTQLVKDKGFKSDEVRMQRAYCEALRMINELRLKLKNKDGIYEFSDKKLFDDIMNVIK